MKSVFNFNELTSEVDFCLSSARTETVAKGVTRFYENGKHKATILGCEDLSVYRNAK